MTKQVEYTVINISEFLKLTPSGEFDHDETLRILGKLSVLIASSENNKILFDIRESFSSIQLTAFDVYGFVEELVKKRKTYRNKVAVLTRKDHQFDNAKFFELCAKNRGFEAKAFTDYEKAIGWFSDTKSRETLEV